MAKTTIPRWYSFTGTARMTFRTWVAKDDKVYWVPDILSRLANHGDSDIKEFVVVKLLLPQVDLQSDNGTIHTTIDAIVPATPIGLFAAQNKIELVSCAEVPVSPWHDAAENNNRAQTSARFIVDEGKRKGMQRDEIEWRIKNFSKQRHYYVTLGRDGKTFSCHYTLGGLYTSQPDIADILASLVMDWEIVIRDARNFEEYADNMGLDSDSRKEERHYNDAVQQSKSFEAFLSPELCAALDQIVTEMEA